MARKVRICFPGAIYHVMARGNERARIYRSDKDYQLFLNTLEEALLSYEVVLHAYCLMPNHFHLVVETPQGNLSRFMAWLQTTFTVRYNRRHARSGHLFHGRYRAELVEKESYGRWLIFYVHLNPVRRRVKGALHYDGGLTKLQSFTWSSHLDYAGLRSRKLRGLSLDWTNLWGGTDGYLKAIAAEIKSKAPLDWKDQVRMGLVAGDDTLIKQIKKLLSSKKRETGAELQERLMRNDRREKLATVLRREKDVRIRIWIRVKLLGERKVDLARELGHRSSTSIYQIVRRVEQRAEQDTELKAKLGQWKAFCVVD
ncbi:MAG: transposase [Verrucomicrobiia bacterium]